MSKRRDKSGKFLPSDTDNSIVAKDEDNRVLVVMNRRNPTYELRCPSGNRYTFKRNHPFQVVSEEDVDYVRSQDGFELATKSQFNKFYNIEEKEVFINARNE